MKVDLKNGDLLPTSWFAHGALLDGQNGSKKGQYFFIKLPVFSHQAEWELNMDILSARWRQFAVLVFKRPRKFPSMRTYWLNTKDEPAYVMSGYMLYEQRRNHVETYH